MKRLASLLAAMGLMSCITSTSFAQQTLRPPLTRINTAALNVLTLQYYELSYDVQKSSIWGPTIPVPPPVEWDFTLPTLSWGQTIGDYFNPCFITDCTFGAGFRANVAATPGVGFHARADLGSVDLHCPIGVIIDYPDPSKVQPGQPFTIHTDYYVEPTAYMNINAPYIGASLNGKLNVNLDVAINAQAGGSDLLNIDLFSLLGLPQPNFNIDYQILDTGNLFQQISDYPFVIDPGVLYGDFHVPQLNARGWLQNDTLRAHPADSFLTVTADVTNALVEALAFGLPVPFNGSYGSSSFGGDFQLLDLKLQGDLGVAEDIQFDPRPLISFQTSIGQTVTVRAGEDVTLNSSFIKPTTITPTIICDQNQFTNELDLTITPSATFDLLHLTGHGEVSGFTLFSFDVRPIPTLELDTTFDLPIFSVPAFALPAPSAFTCPPYTVGHFNLAALTSIESMLTKIIQGTPDGNLTLQGKVNHFQPGNLLVSVQGGSGFTITDTVPVDANGNFAVTISPDLFVYLGVYHPLTVQVSTAGTDPHQLSNPVTVFWLRPPDSRNEFGQVVFDPNIVPNGQPTTYVDTGQFTVDSPGLSFNSGATFLYDNTPIPTSSTYTDHYILFGDIPGYLLNRGGTHTLSFVNPGLDSNKVLIQTLTVDYAVPTINSVRPLKGTPANPSQLVIRGANYTIDSTVTVAGGTRKVHLISPTELRADLKSQDLLPGTHQVVISNPSPGGGSASSSYSIAIPPPDSPRLAGIHSLLRQQQTDTMGDFITLTNIGPNELRSVQITSVLMFLNGKIVAPNAGVPQTLPYLGPTESASLFVTFPPNTSNPGDIAVIQVQGTVNNKAFTLSNRMTLPAAGDPPGF